MRKRVPLLVLFLISISILSGGYLLTNKDSEAVTGAIAQADQSQVLTWDCEFPEFKPETIMIYCGDGGAYIDHITWSSWSRDGANGEGEYYKKLCEPNCAEGDVVHAPVKVKLSNLEYRKGKFYLRTLDMRSASGKNFPWGEVGTFHWDLMEFAEQMNWD